MIKKVILLMSLLVVLTACSLSGQYVPTAFISNIEYNKDAMKLEFQLEINNKSGNVISADIILDSKDTQVIEYNKEQSLYSFDNVNSNENTNIIVIATYSLKDQIVENNEILILNITNILSTNDVYFSSQTFLYTGEKYSIYVSNLPENYTVEYEGNDQSEVGIHEVTAKVYNGKKLVNEYEALLIITENVPEIIVEEQSYYYTGDYIEVDYQVSNNAIIDVTYNNKKEIPKEVGIYNVEFKFNDTILASTTMIIKKVEVEIYSTNKTVIYNGEEQEIEVLTNVLCDYEINYQNKTKPVEPGIYHVTIEVQDTNNIIGMTKHLTLTILDSDISLDATLFISQLIYFDYNNIYIELYNCTNDNIDLSNYKLLIGNIENNRFINLEGTILGNSAFSIVSENTNLNAYNFITNYLYSNNNESISLYNEEIIDTIELNNNFNYTRVNKPNIYDNIEWIYSDEVSSLNSHDISLDIENETYVISYKNNNYINLNNTYNLNDYINITLNDEQVLITEDMIISNNININELGKYYIELSIDEYLVIISFEVADIEAPVISLSDKSLTFNLNEEIDYLSLISTIDNTSEVEVIVDSSNVDVSKEGVYEVHYIAYDIYNNVSYKTIYIFIKS